MKPRHWQPALAWTIFLTLALGALLPGLSGGFLFDDYANLNALGDLGGITDLETFKAYLLSGVAGPTGRPIATASFLLDANDWPADPAPFKYTNLLIHLLVFCVLTLALLEFLRNLGWKEPRAQWVALLAAGFWSLHPFLVSTTFYIVQRMAQLAALFVLAGLWGYLRGRRLSDSHPRRANLAMAASLAIGTLLATFSKENGALLPLLALVVESVLPDRPWRPTRWLRWIGLYLPSAAIVLYLARQIDFSPALWPNRAFDQPERLLSEGRILIDYLLHLFVPRIEGAGLFQDGFPISHGLLDPPETLWSLLTLAGLLASAWMARRRFPVYSVAILFFLASHLLESTVIGLELYFEHRNYLASAFLFLPVASGIAYLHHRSRPVGIATALAIGLLLAFLTHERATLWGDKDRLMAYWAFAAPRSPRAQQEIIDRYIDRGDIATARARMRHALASIPDNAYLRFYSLLVGLRTGTLRSVDFQHIEEKADRLHFDAQGVLVLRILTSEVLKLPPDDWRRGALLGLLRTLDTSPQFRDNRFYRRISPYLQARLLLSIHHAEEAERLYLVAIHRQPRVSAALQMVAEMASSGEYRRALRLLSQAESVFHSGRDPSATRQEARFNREITRLKHLLEQNCACAPHPPRTTAR